VEEERNCDTRRGKLGVPAQEKRAQDMPPDAVGAQQKPRASSLSMSSFPGQQEKPVNSAVHIVERFGSPFMMCPSGTIFVAKVRRGRRRYAVEENVEELERRVWRVCGSQGCAQMGPTW